MLNNISFLALFVFLTPCFASDPTKIHSAFSHLVRPFAIYAQCGLNLFFLDRAMMFAGEGEIYLHFSPANESMLYIECWQAVDGILFQLANGTGVFFNAHIRRCCRSAHVVAHALRCYARGVCCCIDTILLCLPYFFK